jgi:hypothetical protein
LSSILHFNREFHQISPFSFLYIKDSSKSSYFTTEMIFSVQNKQWMRHKF